MREKIRVVAIESSHELCLFSTLSWRLSGEKGYLFPFQLYLLHHIVPQSSLCLFKFAASFFLSFFMAEEKKNQSHLGGIFDNKSFNF